MPQDRPGPGAAVRVLDRRVLRGPNHWSRKPMIRLLVDLGELEDFPTDRLPGFRDRLLRELPGLIEHTDAVGRRGGLVERLTDGTWLGHVAEHVAIELQGLAGHHVTRGKTRDAGVRGRYDVLFAYRVESVGLAAGEAAVGIVNALVHGDALAGDLAIDEVVDRLRTLADRDGLGPSTQALVDEASRRLIPWLRLDERNLVQLGWGARARRIRATLTDATSAIGADLAQDKEDATRLLARAGLPVPESATVASAEDAVAAARRIGHPVAVKPVDGNHGRGVGLDLRSDEAVAAAYAAAVAAARRPAVVVQRFLAGRDHRILVVGGRMVACAERIPAGVSGDGESTVAELVDAANRDPRRGDGHTRALTRLRLDDLAAALVREQGLDLDVVPARGRWIALARTANLSTGGTAIDRTDEVHGDLVRVAEIAAGLVGLDVVGIDVVTTDVSRPLSETGGGIVEVNAAPGFRMHVQPTVGRGRNVARAVVDHLFPDGDEGRIPVASVTGTNGKTTTVRMLAHALATDGRRVGMTTTDGIVVDGWRLKAGDMAGPGSARLLLGIPTVEAAVLETARGGLLREGLGVDWNDVAVVTNVTGDHLGLGGIDTIEDLAALKGIVVEAVPRAGTAVLNADDPVVLRMASRNRGALALTSALRPGEAGRGRGIVERHLAGGGLGGLVEGETGRERMVVRRGAEVVLDVPVAEVPATWRGAAWMNVSNALQAACAAIALGAAPDAVARSLRTFRPTLDAASGRLNRLLLGDVEVVVDYAHNVAALRALGGFVGRVREGRRTLGVVSVPGDRRREDALAFGAHAGTIFDELVVADPSPRGRPVGETAEAILGAARSADGGRLRAGRVVPDESAAVAAALASARPGDLVVLCLAHPEAVRDLLRPGRAAATTRSDGAREPRRRPSHRATPFRRPARTPAARDGSQGRS